MSTRLVTGVAGVFGRHTWLSACQGRGRLRWAASPSVAGGNAPQAGECSPCIPRMEPSLEAESRSGVTVVFRIIGMPQQVRPFAIPSTMT